MCNGIVSWPSLIIGERVWMGRAEPSPRRVTGIIERGLFLAYEGERPKLHFHRESYRQHGPVSAGDEEILV